MLLILISILTVIYIKNQFIQYEKTEFKNKINKLIENKDYKNILDNFDIAKRARINEDELILLSTLFNLEKLSHLSPRMDYLTQFGFSRTTDFKGQKIHCEDLYCSIVKFEINDSISFYSLTVESHYGQPVWTRKEMLYNYHIENDVYYFDLNNGQGAYYDFIKKYFYIPDKSKVPFIEKIKEKVFYF